MTEEIDGKTYSIGDLRQIRDQQHEILAKDPDNMEAAAELVCADCLLCEEYQKDMGPAWQNYALCKEIASYMDDIIEKTNLYQLAENVCARAADTLYGHPRLKVRLLEYQRDALLECGGEDAADAEMGLDELSHEISYLQLNIMLADLGKFDNIKDISHLQKDPVEWTKEYEDAIHLAEEKADRELKDTARGMGFCFAYWPTLKRILHDDYQIDWRTPQEMNPRVIFD